MTVPEWLSAWWRERTPAPDHRTAVVPVARPQPRVPADYLSLYTYLEHRYASKVVLTFEQVESLLGFALPEPARTECDWWTRAPMPKESHSDAWTVAGRTAMPNLPARNVAFERLPSPRS